MIFANELPSVNYNQIIYCNETRNNIINGFFTKINYTCEHSILNGLYIILPIQPSIYNNNRIKFNPFLDHNKKIIDILSTLEANILDKYIQSKKYSIIKKKILLMQLQTGFMKIYKDASIYNNVYNNNNIHTYKQLVIKISGIWETSTECGITYKLFEGILL
jgi:hypothetical protein